jgi:hypothetical protein
LESDGRVSSCSGMLFSRSRVRVVVAIPGDRRLRHKRVDDMPRTRVDFRSLTLFEDEESGDTHMAMYATIRDSGGATVAQFKWNNRGNTVNETNTYPLNNDPGNISAVDFELNTFGTITIEAYADDDQDWPTAGSNENSLGSANASFDPRVPATLGSLIIGPTQTDNGNTGYLVNAEVAVVGDQTAADVRLKFENLVLYEDEESGDTHMAIYVRAKGPGVDQEIFRWNNGNAKVNEVNAYNLDNSPDPVEVTLMMTGPTAIIVEGYADDDQDWPSSGSNENALGDAMVVVDPSDPASAGQRQLGPTITDNGNTGYVVNLSIDILPATPQPDLSIAGIEVTQAIQHFHSPLGQDNSVPLVANKLTLVRAYLDSGVDPSINNGDVPGVTGTLTVTGDASFTVNPMAPMTAQPIAAVDPTKFTDTLNFLIPAAQASGTLNLTVEATVGTDVSNPQSATVTFTPLGKLNILIVRVQTSSTSAPTRAQYLSALNQLPLIYPIPTDPGQAIQYWFIPGSEVVFANHDLTTQSGMDDFLDDLEDIQEDSADYKKLYGLVSNSFPLNRTGDSRPSDNVAFGWSFIMESVGHELGHIYGLKHAPCGGPDDTDDNFVPSNGDVGEVGVDPVGQVAFSPNVGDIMSYCGNRSQPYESEWISAYDWTKLFLAFKGF